MTTTTRVLFMVCLLAAASEARAQVQPAPATKGYASVNIGAQPASRSVQVSRSFPVYGETATLATSQTIGSGAVFDVSGGYRVRPNLGVGIGFSNFSNESASTGAVSVPDPLVFNRPRQVTINLNDLKHTERAVHVLATWFYPITNQFDIAVSGGPAFFSVKQELVASVNIPTGTQNATPVVSTEKESTVGVTIGVDGTYLVRRNFGAGAFLRYSGAKVDLPSVADLKVGGFQVGVGARVRF